MSPVVAHVNATHHLESSLADIDIAADASWRAIAELPTRASCKAAIA
jgi:hypothetical protein